MGSLRRSSENFSGYLNISYYSVVNPKLHLIKMGTGSREGGGPLTPPVPTSLSSFEDCFHFYCDSCTLAGLSITCIFYISIWY